MLRRTLLKRAAAAGFSTAGRAALAAPQSSRILVVYFSRAGENYSSSRGTEVIETGHTARIARRIAERTGADVFEIRPVTPYPKGYRDTTAAVRTEQSAGTRRPIETPLPDLSGYDAVFLGHPIWWGELPPPVETFLDQTDLSGKTVIHFCTHGGSGFGRTDAALRRRYPKAVFKEGFEVYGEQAASSLASVDSWLKSIGY